MSFEKNLSFVFTFLSFLIASGQNHSYQKLILHKELKTVIIKEGQLLGVTKIGEEYKYNNWKNVCECNEAVQKNFWILDSIGEKAIGLSTYRYKLSYKLDTIPENKRHRAIRKNYEYKETIPPEKSGKQYYLLVYKIPLVEILFDKHKIIMLDSIQSFTFTTANPKKCLDKTMDKIYFDYKWAGNIKNEKKAGAIILAEIVAVFSEALAQTMINSSVLLYNAVTDKSNVKEFELHEYKLSEWKLKVK